MKLRRTVKGLLLYYAAYRAIRKAEKATEKALREPRIQRHTEYIRSGNTFWFKVQG